MKRLILISLLFFLVLGFKNIYAGDNAAVQQGIQTGLGILGGFLDAASKNANNQKASSSSEGQKPLSSTQSNIGAEPNSEVTNAIKDSKKEEELTMFWQKEQKVLDQGIKDGKILKIKDLYLGMNIDDAFKVLKDKLGENSGIEITEVGPKPDDGGFVIFASDALAEQMNYLVYADDKKAVNTIVLPAAVVDRLFNSAGLPGEEFAKRFADGYKIRGMEQFSETKNEDLVTGWRYISPDGYKIIILTDRSLSIQKVAKPSEIRFD